MEELELFFLEKIRPFEERIRKLEEAERQKDYEITTLKHAVHHLTHVIEELKAKQATVSTKPGTQTRAPFGGKHLFCIVLTFQVKLLLLQPLELEQQVCNNLILGIIWILGRPGTANPAKTETTKPGPIKKDIKPADNKDLKKAGKNVKPEQPTEHGIIIESIWDNNKF